GTLNGSGVATYSTSTLAVATHPITAQFVANASFAGSTSNTVSQVVSAADTAISLANGAPNPSNPGQSVAFAATVTAVSPASGTITTGTVNFFDSGNPIGSAGVNGSGVATLNITTLSSGSHTITARYA